jgi:uncharacterized protein YjbI with pentapeptide repeats
MLTPQRAIVRPRVFDPEGSVALPVEEVVAELLHRGIERPIQILGGPGAGKTTALRHLAAVLVPDPRIVFVDDPSLGDLAAACEKSRVIFGGRKELVAHCVVLRLAPWTDDDLIEYLLAACPGCCTSVMRRVTNSPDKALVQGNPAVWRLTLDTLAAHPELPDIRTAILRWLPSLFRNAEDRRIAGVWSLAIQVRNEKLALRFLGQIAKRDEDFERIRPMRHPWIQRLLAAQHIVDCLADPKPCGPLAHSLPEPLVQEIARHATPNSTAANRLFRIIETENEFHHAMAASILHASGLNWRPTSPAVYRLRGGFFACAAWQGVQLGHAPGRKSDLTDADLTEANLSAVKADHVLLNGARLARAILRKASLASASARSVDLADADLTAADAPGIDLQQANLERAILDSAVLRGAILRKANLTEARLRDAVLATATLRDCQIEGADFSGADFSQAILCDLPLRTATLTGASFHGADLSYCDLEGVHLPAADFHRAWLHSTWLTGSVMPSADFREASLRDAGLADIHWEDADLRGADLRGCTFHMGSTRSGLVGSPYPGHGSKTGFYTDDYYDQGYKRPEEIRKANLRGADLRGAKLDGVDFYLVDLRDAKFDDSAAEHLQRSGAILFERDELRP